MEVASSLVHEQWIVPDVARPWEVRCQTLDATVVDGAVPNANLSDLTHVSAAGISPKDTVHDRQTKRLVINAATIGLSRSGRVGYKRAIGY